MATMLSIRMGRQLRCSQLSPPTSASSTCVAIFVSSLLARSSSSWTSAISLLASALSGIALSMIFAMDGKIAAISCVHMDVAP